MQSTRLEVIAGQPGQLSTLDQAAETLAMRWLLAYASLRTRQNYEAALHRFGNFMAKHKAGPVLAAKRTHLDAWARSMEAEQLKPASVAANLASVSSFFAYAVSEGALDVNPAKAVRRPKVSDKSSRLGLTLETARQVVETAEEMKPNHKAAVALLLLACLRASEAITVKAADITESLGHTVLTVKGKGGEEVPIVLCPMAMRLLGEAIANAKGGTLLQNSQGQPIDRFQLGRIVNAIGRKAKLGRALTPHDLRHGSITSALEAGEPIHLVQAHARHASPVTTQRYDRNRGRLDFSAAYGLGKALAR